MLGGLRTRRDPRITDYYRRHYREEYRRLDELAAELGCAQSAVRGDLRRLSLGPNRTRRYGAPGK